MSSAVDHHILQTQAASTLYEEFAEKFDPLTAPTTPPPTHHHPFLAELKASTSTPLFSTSVVLEEGDDSGSTPFSESDLLSLSSSSFLATHSTPLQGNFSPTAQPSTPPRPSIPVLHPIFSTYQSMAVWDKGDRTLEKLKEHVAFLYEFRWGDYMQWNGFDAEFRDLELESQHDLTNTPQEAFFSALAPQNRMKNRYFNVLPVEKTRVKLDSHSAQIFSSDYVNASYVSGNAGPKSYIACQGCMKETVAEFWSMVWSENSNIIVMLTNIEEGDRPKCYKYWKDSSEEKTIVFGDMRLFTIQLLECEPASEGLISRKLLLTNHIKGETRVVHHFQFVEWPDHGIPPSTYSFRRLLRLVDLIKTPGPIVVHCSAGIGRTGTFCTAHICLHRAWSESPPLFNILGTVQRIRQERPGMVQTKDQYMFCYLAVLDEFLERKGDPVSSATPMPSPAFLSPSSSSPSSTSTSVSSSSSSSVSSFPHAPPISSPASLLGAPHIPAPSAADYAMMNPTAVFAPVDPHSIPAGYDDPGFLPPFPGFVPTDVTYSLQ